MPDLGAPIFTKIQNTRCFSGSRKIDVWTVEYSVYKRLQFHTLGIIDISANVARSVPVSSRAFLSIHGFFE